MDFIEDKISKDEFFKGKKFSIDRIQDYGRKSKFKIKIGTKYYTLITDKRRIDPYIVKMKVLGDSFKQMIGFWYLSKNHELLLLDYFGNNKGIDLIKLENSEFLSKKEDEYAQKLKQIIDGIHSNKRDYVDFSEKHYSSWKEYYLDEIGDKINNIYHKHLIDKSMRNELLQKLEASSKIYENFQSTLIHADITPLNVCIEKDQENLYLIDYDDFKIGDPLMDISRIINCKNMSKVFKVLVDTYYYEYEDNINHLFYTLRVHINWYFHILEKKQEDIYDLDKALKDIYDTIQKIVMV